MMYKITVTADRAANSSAPRWDILPVAKLTCTSEDITQPIFAQAVLCYRPDDGLYVRMWAFETDQAQSQEKSELVAAFSLNPDRADDYLIVRFSRGGHIEAYTVTEGRSKAAVDVEGLRLSLFEGEDLQGEYWGGAFVVPQGLLKARFGVSSYRGGEQIRGNLLHTSEAGGYSEFATLYPTPHRSIDSPDSFGTFELIAY